MPEQEPKLGIWSYGVMAIGATGWAVILGLIIVEAIRLLGGPFDPSLGAVYASVIAFGTIGGFIALLGLTSSAVLPLTLRKNHAGAAKSFANLSLFALLVLLSAPIAVSLWERAALPIRSGS